MKIASMLRSSVVLLLTVSCSWAAQGDPLDWTYARGPHFNGASYETGLIDNWNPKGGPGSNVAWMRSDLQCRCTPIVMDGRVYLIMRSYPGTPKEGERVVCLDAKSGETIWENKFNVYLSDVPDTRVGWSAVVGDPETGNVYAQGVCGHFQCIDGATGKTKWVVPLHERFGLLSTYGGRTNFPIVCEDLVIVSAVVIGWGEMAKPAHRFIAFDKRTGEVVWFNGTRLLPYDTTYSAPSLCVVSGQKTLVFGSGDGAIWGIQPRTGQPIWQYPFSRRGINTPPLVDNGTVYVGHGEENLKGTKMGALVALDVTAGRDVLKPSQTRWRIDAMRLGRTAPVLMGEQLWVFDDRAKLHILDAASGKAASKRLALGRAMRSSPLRADGKVYAFTASGRWYILEPDGQSAKILNKGTLPRGQEVHGAAICSHGRIYVPTTGGLYCLVDESKQSGVGALPEPAQESPVEDDQHPAHLQLVPADALTTPGSETKFRARLFNARGQFLREVKSTFALNGPGKISEDGAFTALGDDHAATIVTARAEGLEGQARIRIVPPLPWHFDFEDVQIDPEKKAGEPPITWVGARYRHVVRSEDGNKVMVKITTIPKGTRSRSWMGPSHLSNYTIQADVRGSVVDGKLPDIGLIAQGYTFDLQGADQAIQIRTWVTQRRMAQTLPFAWKPNTWYRMKLRAAVEGERAVLKGKIWPRDTEEPSDWTLEATDTSPNRSGSPGLFGNAKDAELFIDNVHIAANE